MICSRDQIATKDDVYHNASRRTAK